MSLTLDVMYWGVFLLHPDGRDELESWHDTIGSARLREARLPVEGHHLGWAVELDVRGVLRSELPQYVTAAA